MKTLKLFIIVSVFFSLNSFTMNDENPEIKREEIDKINLEYLKLDEKQRKNMDTYLENIEDKIDLINSKLKMEYILGKKENSDEIFLENLEDKANFFEFGINNSFYIDKNKKINNSTNILINKIFRTDNNDISIGVYGGYNYDKGLENLNGINTGVYLGAKLREQNIYANLFNEYSYSFKEDYKNNFIVGGLNLGYKQEFGEWIYIEPSISSKYLYDVGSNLKFSNTDVVIKNNFKYNIGANIKIGIEREYKENIYNGYIGLGIDKKLNLENKFTLKFSDKDRFTSSNRLFDLLFNVDAGLDVYINKKHRIYLIGNIELNGKEHQKYNINLGYKMLKET